jgi:1-deoxy-D-xylulose-5-phosphate synthase
MAMLEQLDSPADLRRLDPSQLDDLAREIRAFLIEAVCRTGGHLGPNLGVVELTLAVHRVFDSPRTPIVFDTGHQAYVHKLLTGRRAGFEGLRTRGGLSGYPSRAESVHDVAENSHASTALSYADGITRAWAVAGAPERQIVVVVGDGALTGGPAWEALNNLGRSSRPVVVVLNDNGRSYAPTVGGLPRHLSRVADRPGYGDLQALLGGDTPAPITSHGGHTGSLFEALGFGYLGPVDGHDVAAVEELLTQARAHHGPVVVHCLTEKGRGYQPAIEDQADHLHTVGRVEVATGRPGQPPACTWTDAFASALLDLGEQRHDLVAVGAAMLGPTGLQRFADRFPGRGFDVGIAEQHALICAAGMAMAGLHPVVGLYATFANRAFDQELLDVGLHRLPVTLVLDRAGVTGPDGPSHHGMWDLALLGMVPGIRIAAPRDPLTLVEELGEAVAVEGPTVLRFPKARLSGAVPALRRIGQTDVLREGTGEVLLVAVGVLAGAVLDAADLLADEGIEATVVDPRWVVPVDDAVVEVAAEHRLVVTVEDGLRVGGVGSQLAARLSADGVDVPLRSLGLPSRYLPHGNRADILAEHGLDAAGVAAAVRTAVGGHGTRLTLVKGAAQ